MASREGVWLAALLLLGGCGFLAVSIDSCRAGGSRETPFDAGPPPAASRAAPISAPIAQAAPATRAQLLGYVARYEALQKEGKRVPASDPNCVRRLVLQQPELDSLAKDVGSIRDDLSGAAEMLDARAFARSCLSCVPGDAEEFCPLLLRALAQARAAKKK